MNTLKIMIVGTTSSGKSTLAWKFREFLRSEGFSAVDVIDLDESFPPSMNEDRFATLDRTSKIVIETVQANRELKGPKQKKIEL